MYLNVFYCYILLSIKLLLVILLLICYTSICQTQNLNDDSPDFFSHVTDATGTNFGFSIDSYYNRNTKMSINIVGGKGVTWIGVGTDALGHNIAGRTVSLSLKKYVDPEDLLSVVRKIVFP